jgi:hypothetical protein
LPLKTLLLAMTANFFEAAYRHFVARQILFRGLINWQVMVVVVVKWEKKTTKQTTLPL